MHGWKPWLIVYVLLLALIVGGLSLARRQVIATMGTPEAIAEWREWKTATEQAALKPGPVKRRPAKADEPPPLLWFRDFFVTMIVSVSVFFSLFYFFLVTVVRGMLRPTHAVAWSLDHAMNLPSPLVGEGGERSEPGEG